MLDVQPSRLVPALHVAPPTSPSPSYPTQESSPAAISRKAAMGVEAEILPAATASEGGGKAATEEVKRRGGWVKRMMTVPRMREHYSPVGVELHAAAGNDEGGEKPPRRVGWLRRMMLRPRECVQVQHRQRWWKLQGGSGSSSRLAAGLSRSLRWKPAAGSLSGSWATAVADAVAFRVMYVVEAVVLGLALSCFFCCCGCQI